MPKINVHVLRLKIKHKSIKRLMLGYFSLVAGTKYLTPYYQLAPRQGDVTEEQQFMVVADTRSNKSRREACTEKTLSLTL